MKIKKTKFRIKFITFMMLCLLVSIILFSACGPPRSFEMEKPTPVPGTENLSDVERDLKTMRTAEFEFIYLFRRKDGGKLDGEDKKYLKMNSPRNTNRFIITDEDKAAIAGSHYKFEDENLQKLGERFDIKNYSKAGSETNTNGSPKDVNSNG